MNFIRFFTIACSSIFLFSSCEKEDQPSRKGQDMQSCILNKTKTANIRIVQTKSSSDRQNFDICELCSEYKLITAFSDRIKSQTGLFLCSYGINNHHLKEYQFKNGVHDFMANYSVYKTQQDIISLEDARRLIVSVVECLLQEINSNLKVRPDLDTYPMTSDLIAIRIDFKDENHIELGNGGVSGIYFLNGKIKYKRYEIYEYTNRYPFPEGVHITDNKGDGYKATPLPKGKNFPVHEESYADALDIVKKENGLIQL